MTEQWCKQRRTALHGVFRSERAFRGSFGSVPVRSGLIFCHVLPWFVNLSTNCDP